MDGFQTAAGAARLKFSDPTLTADGSERATAPFAALKTLWINTGTLCNIECSNCYIESSPVNDRLAYITAAEAGPLIDEAASLGAGEIGFTGGEPFLNPHLFEMTEQALRAGMDVLVLTNAMRPMMRPRVREKLTSLIDAWGARAKLRVSLDHFSPALHDKERGEGSFAEAMKGLCWLAERGGALSIAGRSRFCENEEKARSGYQALFDAHQLPLDAHSPAGLVLFPEMDEAADPPEITTACWEILGKDSRALMCASSRMVVKRKGDAAPSVLACTLIPYDDQFNLGASLAAAARPVALNHPHCATFCVLGGSSCSV